MVRSTIQVPAMFTLLMATACGGPSSVPDTDEMGLDPEVEGGGAAAGGGGEGGSGAGSVLDPAASTGAGGAQPGGSNAEGTGGSAAPYVPPPVVQPPPVDGVPQCARYPVRSDGLLLDFDTYDPIGGSWGVANLGQLTGGTSAYSCADDGSCPASAAIARVRTGGGALRIQAAVPAQGYTGMVLWFGPCIDASTFGGLEFGLGGELFGATLSVKLQTHLNYPIDLPNSKGACAYTSEADKWSECVPPRHVIASVTEQPSTVALRWADFGEGLPNTGVSPDGLVGVELQFECPSDVDCAMDLRLGALRLVP